LDNNLHKLSIFDNFIRLLLNRYDANYNL